MFNYLFVGDLGANITISDDLINLAKQRLDSNGSDMMLRLDTNLRNSLRCGYSGYMNSSVDDNKFTFESDPSFVNMGNWIVHISANCSYSCGDASGNNCRCDCSVYCDLHVVIWKVYTFQDGYNAYNSWWGIQGLNYLAWLDQMYYHLNPETAYIISAGFDDSYCTVLQSH